MTKRPARLTQAFVNAIETPGRYSDGRRAFGLTLLVKPLTSGHGYSKTFAQRLTLPDGSKRQIGLGAHPLTTLKMARENAFANAQAIRVSQAGIPSTTLLSTLQSVQSIPQAQPTITQAFAVETPVFSEVAAQTIAALRDTWKGDKHEIMWESQLRNYALPILGDLPVNTITSGDVVRVLTPIWTTRHATAKQLKMKLNTIFDHAIARNWIDENPVERASKALPRVKTNGVDNRRALPYQEIPRAIEKINAARVIYPATQQGLIFMILTGVRRDEMRYATWSEIDLTARLWVIPASRMKSGYEHRIPLARQAVDLLERIDGDKSGYVFQSKNGRSIGQNTFIDLLKRNAIDSSVHGFRSAFRTWAEDLTDASHTAKEMALSHRVGNQVEQPYMRSDVLDQRKPLMQAWADFVLPTE